MSAQRVAIALVTCCAFTHSPAVAEAQIRMAGQKGLEFGQVQPAVPSSVSPSDAGRAVFRVAGRGSYIAQFVLPTALIGPTGASFPLSFGASDAIMKDGGTQLVFDPNQPLPYTTALPRVRRFFLGGTAGPSPGVPLGTYTAVITLTIIQAGA